MTDQTPAQLAEPYILDGIRSYLDGPPVVADHRHHRDVDRMAWLLAGVDRLRARNAELSRRLGEHADDLGDARTEIDRLRAHRDQLHTETLRLGISLAEAIHERHQLRTDLAGAERYRTAALAVAADLTDDLTEARAEIERRDVRWDELVEEKNRLIEDSEDLRAQLADAEQARDEAISVAAANAAAYDEARAQLAAPAAERNEYARAAVDAHNAALTAARWDELVAENNQLIEELAEALGIELDPETGGLASHEPATATGALGPDPS